MGELHCHSSILGLPYISCPNGKCELKRGRTLSLCQRIIHCPTTIVLTVAWICSTVPSHNARPGLRIVTQEHEMLSSGITWLSSSASNYQIIKNRRAFFFFLSYFQLKQLNDTEAFAWGRREKEVKMREVPPVNLQAKQGALRWGTHPVLKHSDSRSLKYSRTCLTPPTRAREHPALSRIAPKKSSVCMGRFTPHHRHY